MSIIYRSLDNQERQPKPYVAPTENNAVMRKLIIVLGVAVLVLAASAGWQIGACEIANMNLQEEMRDMAS